MGSKCVYAMEYYWGTVMGRQKQWQTYISHTIDRLYGLLDVELFMLVVKPGMLPFIIMIIGVKI